MYIYIYIYIYTAGTEWPTKQYAGALVASTY